MLLLMTIQKSIHRVKIDAEGEEFQNIHHLIPLVKKNGERVFAV